MYIGRLYCEGLFFINCINIINSLTRQLSTISKICSSANANVHQHLARFFKFVTGSSNGCDELRKPV
jgi:hypothetical protein